VRLPFGARQEMLLRVAAAGRSRETYLQQRSQGLALTELLPGGVLQPAEPLVVKGPVRGSIAVTGLSGRLSGLSALERWLLAGLTLATVVAWRWRQSGSRVAPPAPMPRLGRSL